MHRPRLGDLWGKDQPMKIRTVETVTILDRRTKERRTVKVEVSSDTLEIAQALAQKAFDNKSRVAREIGGVVAVKMLEA